MKADSITFTVLMSVYAKECPSHFAEALESNLVSQTRLPDEMVLVCDGPLTSELEAVISEYQQKCADILKVVRLTENGGLGKALKYGMEQCSCEWIARSDSDDICHPKRFEKQIEYIKKHSIDIVGTDIDEFVDSPTRPIRSKRMPKDQESIKKMAMLRNPINHMTVMFRKTVIESIGSYRHMPYLEDYDLWVRAIAEGARLANMDEILVHARVGNGMASRRGNKAILTGYRALSRFMLEQGMISHVQRIRNMMIWGIFVMVPVKAREIIYQTILRKQ